MDAIFTKAKSAIVNGAKVLLVRKNSSGELQKFDQVDTLEDLDTYKRKVTKYLGQ